MSECKREPRPGCCSFAHNTLRMAARGISRGPAPRAPPVNPRFEDVSQDDFLVPSRSEAPQKRSLPLCGRLIDVVIATWLVFFAVMAGFAGSHSVLAASGSSVYAMKKAMPEPLKVASSLFSLWASKVDPSLVSDAPQDAAAAFVLTLALAPAALALAYGVTRGQTWVKTPALFWAGSVAYSVAVRILGSKLASAGPAGDAAGDFLGGASSPPGTFSPMLLGVYQLFIVVPLVIAVRLHRSRFSRALGSLSAFFLHATAAASWAVFWSYALKFVGLYRPSLLPAELLALAQSALRSLP